MEKKKFSLPRLLGSIFIAIVITFFVPFILLLIMFSAVNREVLSTLFGLSYLSIIIFLVLWNIFKSKKIFRIFLVPAFCIAVAIGFIIYQIHINNIPTVYEDVYLEYRYEPYTDSLPKLDNNSSFKINDNFPVLDGATALYPVYASFYEAVYSVPEESIWKFIKCNRTPGAYKKLLEGAVDIIFCAEPSEAQLKQFEDAGIILNLTAIGKEAFVFFVNKKNPVDNLTVEDIQGIYSGKIKNWKKLGGKNKKIIAFQRPKGSGSQTILEKTMGDIPLMMPRRENINSGMGEIINQVADYRNFSNAIGYSFLFYSTEMVQNDQIKLLAINGVYPSIETIQNKTYPFSNDFYAIYVEKEDKNENIEPFIKWILSAEGQELVQRTGYTPINTFGK